MATFKNLDELYLIWNKQLKDTVDYVTKKCVDTIKIEIDIWGIGDNSKNEFYEATGEFEESFVNELSTRIGDYIVGYFGYNPSNMTFNPDLWQHGSYISGDVSENLADIIFRSGASDLFGVGEWTVPRDAWNSASKTINKNIKQWFIEGFSKNGINIF